MKRNIIHLLTTILATICLSSAFGQTIKIEGQLKDSLSNEELVGATIILLQPEDSVMASFGITNASGEFALRRVKDGDYLFQVSYVGYQSISKIINVSTSAGDMQMGLVTMQPVTEMLDGAIISEERIAVQMRKDTVVYNADAFKTQPNAVVEDLLKKMPGIEVDSDGTITAEGEEVEQVLVDGKAFFGTDAQMATKNLPARAIKEVQVFDKQSDMAKFSGIDDGLKSKTINLKLKEDYKKGAFGSLTGGYGTEDRYNGKFNLNSFNKKNQFSVIGQINNINEQGFSVNEYISFMGGMSNLMRNGRIRLNSQTSAIPISDGLANGDTDTKGIGFNFNRDISKRTKFNLTYFYSQIDNQTEDVTARNFFRNNGDFSSSEIELNDSDNSGHRLSGRIDHEIDSMQSIKLSTSLSLSNSNNASDLQSQSIDDIKNLINESDVLNQSDGQTQRMSSDLTYRRKFNKKGRSIVGSLSYANAPYESDVNLNSENIFYNNPSRSNTIIQEQSDDSEEQDLEFSTTWTEPLGKRKYLGLTYSFNQLRNDSEKDVFDIDTDMTRTKNDLLSLAYDQQTDIHVIKSALRWIADKSNLNVSLGFQRANFAGNNMSVSNDINREYSHLLPSLRWNYDFTRTKSVSINYETSINQPTLNQLQPLVDNSDPLNIYMGNPDLRPNYTHRVNLRFRNFSQFANTSLFGNITLNFVENDIVNSTSIDQQLARIVTPVNINNTFRGNMWLSFGAPLRFIDSRISTRLNLTYRDGATVINAVENNTESTGASISVSLENKKKEIIDWSFGGEFDINQTTYADGNQNDQQYSNQTYWAELTTPLKSWSISTGIDVNIYNDNFSSSSQTLPIWKASLSKFILQRKGEIKLSAFDILDENEGYQQNINLNYIEEVRSNTIGQYFMLSYTHIIGSFKQNSFMMTGPRRRR